MVDEDVDAEASEAVLKRLDVVKCLADDTVVILLKASMLVFIEFDFDTSQILNIHEFFTKLYNNNFFGQKIPGAGYILKLD